MIGAIVLPVRSVVPPGEKGIMNVIGLLGHSAACPEGTSRHAIKPTIIILDKRVFFIGYTSSQSRMSLMSEQAASY
jgi:hypothetical protein